MNAFVESWTSWLSQQDERVFLTAILGLALYTVVRVMEWVAQFALSDERRRYTIRKFIRYTAAGVFGVSVIGIWAQWLQGLLLILGTTGAGLAIVLAPVIVSIAGWVLITSSNLYKVGDRVQLGGVIGDVTDVGILRTSLLEIGYWVAADQLTGRVVAIPNAAVFKDPVFNYTQGLPISGMNFPCRFRTDLIGNERSQRFLAPSPTMQGRLQLPRKSRCNNCLACPSSNRPTQRHMYLFPSRNIGWPVHYDMWSMPCRGGR